MVLYKSCLKCKGGDLVPDGEEYKCFQCGQRYYPNLDGHYANSVLSVLKGGNNDNNSSFQFQLPQEPNPETSPTFDNALDLLKALNNSEKGKTIFKLKKEVGLSESLEELLGMLREHKYVTLNAQIGVRYARSDHYKISDKGTNLLIELDKSIGKARQEGILNPDDFTNLANQDGTLTEKGEYFIEDNEEIAEFYRIHRRWFS